MKNPKLSAVFLALLLLIVPILCSCTHAQADTDKKDSILQIFNFSADNVKISGIRAKASVDEVLETLALAREDCEIFESEAVSGNTIVDPIAATYYDEFGAQEVDVIYTFGDDALQQISYNVAFWDSDFETAYEIASNAFLTIEDAMPTVGALNCEGLTLDGVTKSADLLDQFHAGVLGSRVIETWETADGTVIYLDVAYQDRSGANYKPQNVVCMQLNIIYLV